MNHSPEPLDDSVEARLARVLPCVAVDGLRAVTLRQVQRELRAARWDRRLGRLAAVLLAVGVAMNFVTVNRRPAFPPGGQIASRPTTESIAGLAVTLAEATDRETANLFARHLAALSGFPAGSDQASTIEREINRRFSPALSHGKDG